MLKKCVIVITIFILGIIIGISIHKPKKESENNSISSEQSELDIPEHSETNSIARKDYPLIDIYFQSDSNYRVEIVDFMDNKKGKEVKGKGEYFQKLKGDFSVMTIPTGMGTTAEFYLSVYEDGKCIKELECISIESDVFVDKWIEK